MAARIAIAPWRSAAEPCSIRSWSGAIAAAGLTLARMRSASTRLLGPGRTKLWLAAWIRPGSPSRSSAPSAVARVRSVCERSVASTARWGPAPLIFRAAAALAASVRARLGAADKIRASFGKRASAAGWGGRGESGRQSPITGSRPCGSAHWARRTRAMARVDSGKSNRPATSASLVAFSTPPSRKLAFRTRRTRGSGMFAATASAASRGRAAAIGTSLIARAASSTTRGSGSSRNPAVSGSALRRNVNKTPIRTATDGSWAACFQAAGLPEPASPITPACRK